MQIMENPFVCDVIVYCYPSLSCYLPGSRYFENEVKKEEQVNRKIEEQMRKIPKLTEATIQQGVVIVCVLN